MNRDEQRAAEALASFIETGEAGTLPPPLAASADALGAHAHSIAPDATFAARLEARLLAQHAAPSEPPRRSWLAALFRPVGRLAWAGLVVLLAIGLTLMLRALSQGEARPAGVSPTGTPGEPTPVVTLTPTEGAATVVTTQPAAGDPERYPITELVRTPALALDGLSPDGQWVTYWELSEEGGMTTPGQLVLSDRTGTELCTPSAALASRDNLFEPRPWLADGRYLYMGEDGGLRLLDEPCGEPRSIAPAGSWLTPLAASDDGQQLALMGQDRLWLWREGEAIRPIGDEGSVIFPGASFSPDGRWLAVSSGPSADLPSTSLTLREAATGQAHWTHDLPSPEPLGGTENRPGEPPLWLDAERMVVTLPRGEPLLFTVGEGGPSQPLSTFFGVEARPDSFHDIQSNGSTLLWQRAGEGTAELLRYDLATGEVMSCVVSAENPRALLAPTSADVLLVDEGGGAGRLWVESAGGEIIEGPAAGMGIEAAWAPDGRRYAVGSSEGLALAELDGGGTTTVTPLAGGWASDLHWGADGALWAVVRTPDGARLLRVEMP